MEKNCSAFLIGCNITDEKIPNSAAISRKPLDKLSKDPVDGVLKDLKLMKDFMSDRKIPVFDVTLANRHVKQNKSDMVEVFKKFFYQKGTRRFVIYYSGHGSNGELSTNKGDWCFETNNGSESAILYIALKDILDPWDEMRKHFGSDLYELDEVDMLFIIADSSYSGGWVEKIKERPYKKTPSGKQYRDVHMIASCEAHNICYYTVANGGDFTRRYITADSSKHNLVDTGSHLAKLAGQSIFQTLTFPLYMPLKGAANYYNATSHKHTPVATNEKEEYRVLLMKFDGDILPIGTGLGIASGWSWMLSGQIFHN